MISREEIQHLAGLARLKLSDAEVGELQKDISNILDYVGQVTAVQGEPSDTPVVRNVMRDDTPRAEGHLMHNKEEAVKAAFPTREGEYNVVRKIIQKDE